ncbi:MAG: sigma-54-dependent Fis family transcriptional regulator [Treponema sp.]|nr:sigma-54-dependent Fis family transcriptional regulator [Treponema sp.]
MQNNIILMVQSHALIEWCRSVLPEDFDLLRLDILQMEECEASRVFFVEYALFEQITLVGLYRRIMEREPALCVFIMPPNQKIPVLRHVFFPKAHFIHPGQRAELKKILEDFAESAGNEKIWDTLYDTHPAKPADTTEDDYKRFMVKAAQSDATILLLGETGSGKSYTAEKIHRLSMRKQGPFFTFMATETSEHSIESDLFGTVKGAFTGAENHKGVLEQAEGGTLFFDEIADLPLRLQSKLLGVIENRSFRRKGSMENRRFNARLIFATNADLRRLLHEHKFREDLYYRINTLTFTCPPLKDRPKDLSPLAALFANSAKKSISPEAMNALSRYHWPGNIRELKNAIERAAIFAKGSIIQKEDFRFLGEHLLG